VIPTSQVIHAENVWREDIVESSLPLDAVLANAPERVGDFFAVQAIFD
jgi:Asp-tRNA(Asn)/Glu-tRNA(Gln) amidotransferase C subunit